jgi:hypothetical protein
MKTPRLMTWEPIHQASCPHIHISLQIDLYGLCLIHRPIAWHIPLNKLCSLVRRHHSRFLTACSAAVACVVQDFLWPKGLANKDWRVSCSRYWSLHIIALAFRTLYNLTISHFDLRSSSIYTMFFCWCKIPLQCYHKSQATPTILLSELTATTYLIWKI